VVAESQDPELGIAMNDFSSPESHHCLILVEFDSPSNQIAHGARLHIRTGFFMSSI